MEKMYQRYSMLSFGTLMVVSIAMAIGLVMVVYNSNTEHVIQLILERDALAKSLEMRTEERDALSKRLDVVTERDAFVDTKTAAAEINAQITKLTAERDNQVAFYRGLLHATMRTQYNILPPQKEGDTYSSSPVYDPVTRAMFAGHPTPEVSFIFSEDRERVLMQILLGEGYAMNLLYPKRDTALLDCFLVTTLQDLLTFETVQSRCSRQMGVSR